MKLKLAIVLAVLAPLSLRAQISLDASIQIGIGTARSYRLYIPANYYTDSTPRPLLINLHGLGSTAFVQEGYGDFRSIADTAGFLIVHPDATLLPVPTFWNTGFLPIGPDDLGFISSLIDTMRARYRIDPRRVYSAGYSNGGFMSYYLASHLSHKVAAVASVSGSIVPQTFAAMPAGARPIPAMEIHGTLDPTVPYAGGPNAVHTDTVVKYWVTKNGCNPVPQVSAVPNTVLLDGCTAQRFVWSGGTSGNTVEFFKINNGGHSWPGATQPLGIGLTSQDFNASHEVWRFLRQYELPLALGVAAGSRMILQLQVWPNPARDVVRVEATNPGGKAWRIEAASGGMVEVIDIAGRVMVRSANSAVQVTSLAPGRYFLRYTTAGGVGTASFVKE